MHKLFQDVQMYLYTGNVMHKVMSSREASNIGVMCWIWHLICSLYACSLQMELESFHQIERYVWPHSNTIGATKLEMEIVKQLWALLQ
jgi:hypothetical protein